MKKLLFCLFAISLLTSCKEKPSKTVEATPEKEEVKSEWIALFDGTTTEGWRAYNEETLPPQ